MSTTLELFENSNMNVKPVKPFIVNFGKNSYSYFLVLPEVRRYYHRMKALRSFPEFGCVQCTQRAFKYAHFLALNSDNCLVNPFLVQRVSNSLTETVAPVTQEGAKAEEIKVHLISNAVSASNDEPSVDGYNHWVIPTTDACELNGETIEFYQAALHKYIPLMLRLFERLGKSGFEDSIYVVVSLLPKVIFGNKIEEAAKWAKKWISEDFGSKTPVQQVIQVSNALLSSPIFNTGGVPTCPWFHQISSNLSDLMAKAHDEKSFINMINDRFSPENYQRRTAKPSERQTVITTQTLGEFEMYTLDLSDVPDCEGVILESNADDASMTGSNSSASSSYASSKACGFATRCTKMTFMDLMLGGKEFWIEQANHPICYALGTTLAPSLLTPAYVTQYAGIGMSMTWCFYNSPKDSDYQQCNLPCSGWVRVCGILPMGLQPDGSGRRKNYLLMVDNALVPSNRSRGCFPEMLKDSRVHGKAFEAMTSKKPILLWAKKPACGYGFSVTDNKGTVGNLKISFSSDGSNPITVSSAW